jgi:hypothetical protein
MEATQKDFADMHNERDDAVRRVEELEAELEGAGETVRFLAAERDRYREALERIVNPPEGENVWATHAAAYLAGLRIASDALKERPQNG